MQQISSRPRRRPLAGFTLVELMVVVLIVSILAAISYPGYRSHVVRTQRAAAAACLMQYAQLMERFYTTQLTYEGADEAGGVAEPGCADEDSMPQHFTFEVDIPSATTYTVSAVQTETFAQRDTRCGNLTLNQAGERGVSEGESGECW